MLFVVLIHIFVNVLCALIVFSSDNFFIIFVLMEISNFFYYPIFITLISPSTLWMGMKFFIIQAVASSLFLLGSFLSKDSFIYSQMGEYLLLFSLVLKLGLFPFIGWVLIMLENVPWLGLIYLLTIQKIIPFIILPKVIIGLETPVMVICLMTLSLMCILICSKVQNVRWLLILSSNVNLCWIILGSMLSMSAMLYFIAVYFMSLTAFFYHFFLKNKNEISEFFSASLHYKEDLFLGLVVYLITGLPPLGVFLPKLEIVCEMIELDWWVLLLYNLVVSAIFSWFYTKIIIWLIMGVNLTKSSWFVPYTSVYGFVFLTFLFFFYF